MVTVCPQGHELKSSADRDADGWCRHCRKQKNATYRSRQRSALVLAMALESHGIEVTRRDPPVDLQALASALASGYVPHQAARIPTEAKELAQR